MLENNFQTALCQPPASSTVTREELFRRHAHNRKILDDAVQATLRAQNIVRWYQFLTSQVERNRIPLLHLMSRKRRQHHCSQ